MGSGSSSRKSTPESNSSRSMPEPTQGGGRGPQRPRGRKQFEEVQLQDPNALQRTSSDSSTGAGANATPPQTRAPAQPQNAPYAATAQPGYQSQQPGYQGYGGANNQWQNAGYQIQSEQQVLNQFQTYKQPKLEAQPGQNPDEFFSMALQLQEMVSFNI